jgi:hypothetical protein
MSELVTDCPRCRATRTTFDVEGQIITRYEYNWQTWYELFCVCRHCNRSTIFRACDQGIDEKEITQKQGGLPSVKGSINRLVRLEGFISLKDEGGVEPPEYLPEDIKAAFVEGATCKAVKCHNAAAAMFRLCIDLATRPLLPATDEGGLNRKVRRDLGLRLPWLFDHDKLPEGLRDLSTCVKEDGNDGAHAGTLGSEDAEDLLDFTLALLERMFTEKHRLELAKQRREDRRSRPRE